MKVTKTKGFITSVILFTLGFILNILAWTYLQGPELNTISLLLGLFLMLIGFALFIASFWLDDY